MKTFVILGAILGGLSVAAGAFGAHALRAQLEPRMREVFETAARYQMYHALALFAAAWLAQQTEAPAAHVAGWAFVVGIVLFSAHSTPWPSPGCARWARSRLSAAWPSWSAGQRWRWPRSGCADRQAAPDD